ncbi:hypothetical protein [Neorhodopirellula pilleata]|uniref:Uncharacterized protein n=1 Tax=Neorhodopirellula pilleata TaxID=2714738 RepID=A0A5C6AT84_9BACT|nr:hypothetical protein [Neorhodopirellula pilleata]TWU01354.1 hypothetical protein Pla100_10810 [Neorhodopirellula pilleata]
MTATRLKLRWVTLSFSVVCWAFWAGCGIADEPQSDALEPAETVETVESVESVDAVDAVDRTDSPLATSSWRGRSPRWIGLYGSQIADLVPEDFRPISIDELNQAILDDDSADDDMSDLPITRCLALAKVTSTSVDSPATLGDARQTSESILQSLSTTLYLPGQPSDSSSRRFRLGPLNLSVRRSNATADEAAPPSSILCGLRGDTYIVGSPGAEVTMDWSLRSELTHSGQQWLIRLPDATVTDFYVSVDANESIDVERGTVEPVDFKKIRSIAKIDTAEGIGRAWYRIAAIPQSTIRLTVSPRPTKPSEMTVVRGCRLSARLVGDQLKWSARLTLDRQPKFPPIRWEGGELTSLQRDGREIPLDQDAIELKANNEGPRSTSTLLVYEGVSSVPNSGTRLPLPRPIFDANQFFVPPQAWQLQLDIEPTRLVSDFQLPGGWTIGSSSIASTTSSIAKTPAISSEVLAAQSNDLSVETATRWVGSGPAPTDQDPWSIKIERQDALVFASHQIRFEVDETSIQARAKLIVEMPSGSVRPITLEVQDGFQFDFVGVGAARRNVTAQVSQGASRRLTIWPGADEVETDQHQHGRLTLYVNARARRGAIPEPQITETPVSVSAPTKRPLSPSQADERSPSSAVPASNQSVGNNQAKDPQRRTMLGPLWLMRVNDCPGQLLATIIPPANLSWTAKAAIDPSRIEFADLNSEQRRFFAPLPGDAIVFGGAIESTPLVELENPDVDLSVSVRSIIGLGGGSGAPIVAERSDPRWESLSRTIEVKTEGTSGVISSMRIRFAGRDGDDDQTSRMSWSIRMRPDEPEIPIADSDVARQWIESIGVWELRIALPAKHSNQSTLIGRQQRSIVGSVASSDGVWLGLPNVPDAASQVAEVWIDPSLQLRRQTDSLLGVPALANPLNANAISANSFTANAEQPVMNQTWSRFRYEADDQPWIEVERRRFAPPAVLVVQQRLQCIASVGGTDTLRLSCLARTDSDLRLSFPAGLQLTKVRLDGNVVTPKIIPGQGAVIPHAKDPGWVSLIVDWISPASNDRWYRWYEFPDIELNELVVDAHQEVTMASGTLALQTTFIPWLRDSSTAVLLVPSGMVGGIGWLSALLLLGLARMTGIRGIPIITSGIGLAILAGILWPSTILPMASFVALPLTLAALQGSTSHWLRRNQEQADSNRSPSDAWTSLRRLDGPRQPGDSVSPSGQTYASAGSNRSSGLPATQVHDAGRDENSNVDFSSSAILPWIIAVWLSLSSSWLDPTNAHSQETTDQVNRVEGKGKGNDEKGVVTPTRYDANDPARPAIDVLVPLKKDGEILGDKLYIPEAFYNELFFKDVGPRIENALIAQAQYRLRLRSTSSLERDANEQSAAEQAAAMVEALQSGDCVRLQVDLGLTRIGDAKRLRLPYQAEQVQDVRLLDSVSANSIVEAGLPPRFGRDEDGWLWIETASDEDLAVRLVLRCQLDWDSPWASVNVKIPTLAISELTIQTERNVHSVMIQTPRSSRFIPCDQPSINDPFASDSRTIAMGTMSALNLRFRFDDSSTAVLPWNDPDQWRIRYWIYAQKDRTVVECEMEPRLELPPRAVVSLQSTLPGVELLCQDWRIERRTISEDPNNATGSESLRMVSLASPKQPIRLGWSIPTPADLRASSGDAAWEVALPQVWVGESPIESISDNVSISGDNLPWTAWTFSSEVQANWSEPLPVEPLAVDQFYSQWSGYLRSIDRATVGFVGSLKLRPKEKPRTQWLTRHAIDINETEQRIKFLAEIKPPVSPKEISVSGTSQYSLRMPSEARILDWRYAVADGPAISPSRDLTSELLDNATQPIATKTGETTANANATPHSTMVPWKVVRRRTPDGDQTTLYFDGPASGFVIEVDAVLPHESIKSKPNTPKSSPSDGAFKLGWMELEHVSGSHASLDEAEFEQIHDLQITRSLDTYFKWIKSLDAQRITEPLEDAAALLTAGKVLVERFTATGPLGRVVGDARFRVRKLNSLFDVDSRITLRWEEGRWTAQTDCEIKSKFCPDFIDVALPTRWCDSLQIDPLCVSSRQPTLDPALQVMRIELRSAAPEKQSSILEKASQSSEAQAVTTETQPVRKFRLVSRLAVSETARVSVPDIRILDARRHRIDVVVPTRLTNEQVRWRSNFAGPVEKPRWTVSSPMRLPDDSASSVYAVTSPGWSIDLETLPQTNRRAKCLHADHRVLVRPNESRALMISRFDIWPGDQSFVRLSHSGASELLGVWAATRPADLQELESEQDSDDDYSQHEVPIEPTSRELKQWDVPLPLSRLSQTVEVLTSFRLRDFHSPLSPDESYSLLLPSLVGVSDPDEAATISWCETTDVRKPFRSNAADWIESPISPELRCQILASSLVRAIAASSDALADRRDEEVAVWMRPWLKRFHVLSRSVGRTVGQDELPDNQESPTDSTESSVVRKPPVVTLDEFDVNESIVLPWSEMDRFIMNQETRYFAGDSESFASVPLSNTGVTVNDLADGNWSDFLSLSTPPGYLPRWTFQWRQRTLPVARLALHPGWIPETTRQHIMRAGVFVAATAFVFVPVIFPLARRKSHRNGHHEEPKSIVTSESNQSSSGNGLRHPAAWLFALGMIGLLLMPIPMSLGLMFAAVVMSGIDPGYPALRRWWGA